jgi:tetratricopeptide (TPR) repeat protein
MASIAYIRRRQGHFEEAANLLERAVELNPRSTTQSRALGTTYMALRRYEEADRQLAETMAISPDAVGPRIWWAHNLFLWRADGEGAVERMAPLLHLGVETFKFNQVIFLMGDRDFEGALAVLGTMEEELYPNQFFANSVSLRKASALRALGRNEEARAAAEVARAALEDEVLANPDDPRMHGSLGLAYALLGREQEARRETERAAKLQPVEMDAMEGGGRILEQILTYSILEDDEKTLEALGKLLQPGRGSWISIPVVEKDAAFDFVRDDPRYQELIRP